MTSVVRFEPRGAAADLFRSRDSELCIVGAAGTGKSLACLYRLHLVALSNPNVRFLIVRKTSVSLTSTTLVTFKKKVAAEALAAGLMHWYGGSKEEAAGYRYHNGSTINVGGMNDPTRIMSSEYDIVFADEATELTVDDWEAIGSRLRNGVLPWQQQIAAANPGHPQHWLKQRADAGGMRMLTSLHRDNPRYVNTDGTYTAAGRDYIVGKLGALTGVRRARLLHGQWAAAEGMIYETWSDALHLVDKFDPPQEWRRIWSVDFGYTNPTVVQWWAIDPDGRMWLYREIYMTRQTVDQIAAQILNLVTDSNGAWKEPRPSAIICDHDAEGRAVLERELKMTTRGANKKVTVGIQAVQKRLDVAGDGKPRLFVMRECRVKRDQELVEAKLPTCTYEEISGYIWDTARGVKEAPVKKDDHGCDAARYAVLYLDPPRRTTVKIGLPHTAGSLR